MVSALYGLFDISFQMWSDFLDEQWPLHIHDSFPALKYKDVRFLRNILDGFFVHGRDHAITHTHVFCPLFAWQVYKAILSCVERLKSCKVH